MYKCVFDELQNDGHLSANGFSVQCKYIWQHWDSCTLYTVQSANHVTSANMRKYVCAILHKMCMCTVYWINCKIMVICRNKCTLRKYVIISGQLLYVWGANVLQLIFNIIQYKFIIVKYKLITVQYMFIIVQYNFIIIQYKFKINIYVIRAAAVCMGC